MSAYCGPNCHGWCLLDGQSCHAVDGELCGICEPLTCGYDDATGEPYGHDFGSPLTHGPRTSCIMCGERRQEDPDTVSRPVDGVAR